MTFLCIICINSCTSAKQVTAAYRIQWSTALRESWTVASIRSFVETASKGDTGASFYLMATAPVYSKIHEQLSLSYEADQHHSPYSLCLPLEHKALWHRAYFEGIVDLFENPLLCLDAQCMQVIFSWNKLSKKCSIYLPYSSGTSNMEVLTGSFGRLWISHTALSKKKGKKK